MASEYRQLYHPRFVEHLNKNFKNLRERILEKVKEISEYPYLNTESLKKRGKYDFRGLRSARIGRNFRIIFGICEECLNLGLKEKNILYCRDCEEVPKTVIFLTVGPHEKAYRMK